MESNTVPDYNADLQPVSKEHENFLREFIQIYKENPVLWDKNHPKHKNKDARSNAYDIVLGKCREYFPEVNSIDFVKNKIESMKSSFRRERKKVKESKCNSNNGDSYMPSLWYYNLLLFLVGEEPDEELDVKPEHYKHVHFWTREYTICLIEALKKYPILYSKEGSLNSAKRKRMKALNMVKGELCETTGKSFEMGDIKKKVATLKSQFRRECLLRGKGRHKKTSVLWCYDLLLFLKDGVQQKTNLDDDDNLESDEEADEDTDDTIPKDCEAHLKVDNKDDKLFLEEYDDIFDTIGKNVAIKLRDMTDDQRKYAENLINEIMYRGLMESLTQYSRISSEGL